MNAPQSPSAHRPRPLNIFHTQFVENRLYQLRFILIEVTPGLLLEHPDDIDKLLRANQILLRPAALRIGNIAQEHQRLRRESDQECAEAHLGRLGASVRMTGMGGFIMSVLMRVVRMSRFS